MGYQWKDKDRRWSHSTWWGSRYCGTLSCPFVIHCSWMRLSGNVFFCNLGVFNGRSLQCIVMSVVCFIGFQHRPWLRIFVTCVQTSSKRDTLIGTFWHNRRHGNVFSIDSFVTCDIWTIHWSWTHGSGSKKQSIQWELSWRKMLKWCWY